MRPRVDYKVCLTFGLISLAAAVFLLQSTLSTQRSEQSKESVDVLLSEIDRLYEADDAARNQATLHVVKLRLAEKHMHGRLTRSSLTASILFTVFTIVFLMLAYQDRQSRRNSANNSPEPPGHKT